MTDRQKKAIMTLNALFEHCGEKVFSYDDYFLLLEFVVGEKEIQEAKPILIGDINRKLVDMPQTVMYGCGIPDTLTTYDSTETDNSNKI